MREEQTAGSRPAEAPKRLGDILIEEGVLVREEVDKLLELQASQQDGERQPLGKLAVELGFLSERKLRDLLDLHGKRLSLGELLIARGLVSADQVEQALEIQGEEGGLLGEVLIERGWIEEVALTEVLAEQSDIPYVPLRHDDSWKLGLTALVNQSYALSHGLVPISQIGRVLTVAIWHPATLALQQEIEQSTGLRVRFVLDMRRAVLERIQDLYGLSDTDVARVMAEQKNGPGMEAKAHGTQAVRYTDLGLSREEADVLGSIHDGGEGVFVVCGVTQDQVEDVYLRLLRFGKASGGLDSARKVGSLTGLGETKDPRAAESLFRDIRTGELRLAIVSAANTTLAFSRLITLGVHPERLAKELLGAVAVCSVRQNCEGCVTPYQPHKLVLAEWFGARPAPTRANWRRGTGCDLCGGTGYRGAKLVSEFWTPTESEREWMRMEGAGGAMRQFREDFLHRVTGIGFKGLQMAVDGKTTLEEVLKVLPPQEVRSVRQAA
ncbi:MAG: hypothetical protein KDA27_23465 [Candidatus Eisenbacteria bacterium]|uniref:Type II secretion system protein GspE N-terminal domain-containing protein n=1 Tax=Eiseniibacteriota bacterium TaxID=2212470 RepID=A0A956NHA7_UNCEI|nr:hypothetical protein [Candidatus Eisenbacteria bacterium]MCB9463791.1 hypothetical protein [Candidatus Eisenbacteria bacterium]